MARRSDPRFDDMHHAPIFKKVKKENFKTKLDDRFKTVLTDDRFNASAIGEGVDKHGKKKSGSKKKAASELKAFYNIEDKTGKPSEGEEKAESRLDYLSKLSRGEISGSDSDSSLEGGEDDSEEDSDSDDSDSDDALSSRKGGALSIPGDRIITTKRRKGEVSVSASVGQSGDNSNEDEEDVDVDSSSRLAIQNCDWDNMSAEDIMAILQSFCSTLSLQSGSVKAVTVYPSDYGLERIEAENMYGPPKEIWGGTNTRGSSGADESGSESESSSDPDDEDEDESGNIHIFEKDNQEELLKSGISFNEKVRKKREFERGASSAGLVFNLENADSDDEALNDSCASKPSSSKAEVKADKGDSINALALREYELSKLRYYFAIAELDNPSVAEKLYEELDGIEFEHSSMALDLRYVPNDVSFEGRKVRDRYEGNMSAGYTPPEGFVVNALQKTNVECTWENDDGRSNRPMGGQMRVGGAEEDDEVLMLPKGGSKKNTTASAWRRLQESDMSQYMASDGSSDEEEDGEVGTGKKQRAANLRKLLLGGGEDAESEDDFFMHSEDDVGSDDSNDESSGDEDDKEGGDTDKVMTFMPTETEGGDDGASKKKSRKQKKAEKEATREDWEVPQETLKRLREEKRAEKKKSKRPRSDAGQADGDEDKKNTELELLFAGDADSDEEGRDRLNFTKKQLAVAAELKKADSNDPSAVSSKKKRKLSKSKAKLLEETNGDSFELDMTDSRFSKVLEGDANYGIDRLSNEYRPTQAMEMILKERNSRKIAADKAEKGSRKKGSRCVSKTSAADEEGGGESSVNSGKLSHLANKLKKNFNTMK